LALQNFLRGQQREDDAMILLKLIKNFNVFLEILENNFKEIRVNEKRKGGNF